MTLQIRLKEVPPVEVGKKKKPITTKRLLRILVALWLSVFALRVVGSFWGVG